MNRIVILFSLILLLVLPGLTMAQNTDSIGNSWYILTPKVPDTPRINGPKVYGERPGAPFMFRIPATGIRPMTFSVNGLPKGLSLDQLTGVISGVVRKAGTYDVILKATNSLGVNERGLKIVIGDDIALTPPMGWNSWNVWGNTVSQEKVLSSAKAMVESGLSDYGWSYINMDDGWQGVRGGNFNGIQPNHKFPDMKGLCDQLHAMGLKVGIYSGPWCGSYAGHIASSCDNEDGTYDWIRKGYHNENYKVDGKNVGRRDNYYFGRFSFALNDARQWAEWGIDYLKYDWYPNDVYNTKEMYQALLGTGRDIVLSLSNNAPFALGRYWEQYSNCWRTTGDIRDEWGNMSRIGFKGQDKWAQYRRPGHWPDADMLVVGQVGWSDKTHSSKLTADEQYTHISLWCLFSSPLLIGCDMAHMDDFTFSLLSNNEVLDVDQDPLGIQASLFEGDSTYAMYVKPLEDGSVAVGLFNLTQEQKTIGFNCRSLGISGGQTIRDLWRQKDVAMVHEKEQWETPVAPHGVVLVKVYPGNDINARIVGKNL